MKSSAQVIARPLAYLQKKGILSPATDKGLKDYEQWWFDRGHSLSETVDKAGTPWLQIYNQLGARIDKICYPESYWEMLEKGYEAGIIRKVFEQKKLRPFFELGYVLSFFDTGLYCPYTVSMSTAGPVSKYGNKAIQEQFLNPMLKKQNPWQGATWFTEIGGGSDLANATETIATNTPEGWRLTGEKYFCSNIGAEVAVVSARMEGSEPGFKGLQMFVVPRFRKDGTLNYHIRRIKDKIGTRSVPTGELSFINSEAWTLDENIPGIYLIMEVLNISRIANSIGSVALAQRALAEADAFARNRMAFGKPIAQHAMLDQEFKKKNRELEQALYLAWEAAALLEEVWQEKPPYSPRYHYFRFIAHLAKYWTAELAVNHTRWCMEVYGGMGILGEFGIERLHREALILPIWEGTPHRQRLDGWEVMSRHGLHHMLVQELEPFIRTSEKERFIRLIETTLKEPKENQERRLLIVFDQIARFAAKGFTQKARTQNKTAVLSKEL